MVTVAGGVYVERCVDPAWDQVFGSGGRAAAAIAAHSPSLRLKTYVAAAIKADVAALEGAFGLGVDGADIPKGIAFDYLHSLATPIIRPRPDAIARHPPAAIDDLLARTRHLLAQSVSRADFDHPAIDGFLAGVFAELPHGRGAVVIAGVTPERYSAEDFERIWFGEAYNRKAEIYRAAMARQQTPAAAATFWRSPRDGSRVA